MPDSEPRMCLVCGTANLQKQTSTGLDQRGPPSTLKRYRCENGHVFFIRTESKAASQSN